MVKSPETPDELTSMSEETRKDGEISPHPLLEGTDGSPTYRDLAPEPEREPVIKLKEPTKELAARLLGKVSFKDRINGISRNLMVGDEVESIYSFEEATGFLRGDKKSFSEKTGRVRFFDWRILRKWIGETLCDNELAEAIEENVREYENCTDSIEHYWKNIELIKPIKELMVQRLKQCKEITREETEA